MNLEFPKVNLTKVTDAMEDVNTSLRKLAEEIQKRKDDAMAMAFTRHICDLLSENGVVVEVTEIEQTRNAENRFEAEYGFAFTGINFSEHDKMVAEEKDKRIAELEEMRNHLWEVGEIQQRKRLDAEEEAIELRKELISKNERIIELINEIEEIKKDWCFARMSELEDRHQSDCIRINQLLTTIDVLTERYQKLQEVHGL